MEQYKQVHPEARKNIIWKKSFSVTLVFPWNLSELVQRWRPISHCRYTTWIDATAMDKRADPPPGQLVDRGSYGDLLKP